MACMKAVASWYLVVVWFDFVFWPRRECVDV